MGEALALEGLSVTVGGRAVLEDVSFVAPAGRTTAVLGPSGCGKTTLLRVVCGLQAPTSGRVVLGGVDQTAVPAHRRGIGLAFQDRALFPHLDVAGNVGFGLRMAGVPAPAITGRVNEVLGLVGLADFGERRVTSLSGGEAQRVALARSLAPDPPVLCLDEPLGSLDRVLHDRLVDDLRQLFASLATTVLLVTHDHDEALGLADHLVALGGAPDTAGGPSQVLAAGAPRDVWLRPPSVAAARFLGHQVFDAAAAVTLGVHADGARWVVVHASAVRVTEGGDARVAGARVTGVVFAGAHTVVTVSVPGVGEVRAEVVGDPAVQVGAEVEVAIDPAGVWPIGS